MVLLLEVSNGTRAWRCGSPVAGDIRMFPSKEQRIANGPRHLPRGVDRAGRCA